MRRPVLLFPLLSITALAVATPAPAAECFSMFDAKNALVFQSSSAPIDLSRPIFDEMTRHFPARYLVIADTGGCPEVDRGVGSLAVNAPTRGPARIRPDLRSRDAVRRPL